METLGAKVETLSTGMETLGAKVEVLGEAIQTLATQMDERFAATDARMDRIEANMTTKDFVDRKVDGAEARLTARISGTDDKVTRLVDALERKDVLTARQAQNVILGK